MVALTQAPWEIAFEPLPRAQILVINNVDVAWARGVCEYYCDQRGIPRENILDVHARTDPWFYGIPGPDYVIDPAEIDAMLTTVAAATAKKTYTAIIFGPAFPTMITVKMFNTDGTIPTGAAVEYGNASLCEWLACAVYMQHQGPQGQLIGLLPAELENERYLARLNPNPIGPEDLFIRWWSIPLARSGTYDDLSQHPLTEAAQGATWTTTFPASYRVPLPSAAQHLERFSESWDHPFLPFARLGWSLGFSATVTPLPAETAVNVTALIDRATAAMAESTLAVNKTKRHVWGFTEHGTYLPMAVQQACYAQMQAWGFSDMPYFYTGYPPPTSITGSPSFEGAWANTTTLDNGSAPHLDYFCLMGGSRNGSPVDSDDTRWYCNAAANVDSRTTVIAGGHGMLMMPSFPYVANVRAVAVEGSVAGWTATNHQGGAAGQALAYSVLPLLLQGMSYLEAACWIAPNTQPFLVPCGDPLYAPYARTTKRGFQVEGGVSSLQESSVATFNIPARTDGVSGELCVSSAVPLIGIKGRVRISVSDGEYSLRSATSGFTTRASYITQNARVWLRRMCPAYTAEIARTTLYVHDKSAVFAVSPAADTSVEPFSFPNATQINRALSSTVTTFATELAGFNAPITVSIDVGEFNWLPWGDDVWVSGSALCAPMTGANYLRIRHTAAGTNSTTVISTVTAGGQSATLTSTTVAA